MRVISTVEVAAVSGGWTFAGIWGSIEGFFGGGSSGGSSAPACQPGSYSSGGTSVTQLCGAGGVSTTVTKTEGVVITQVTSPAPGGTATASAGNKAVTGSLSGTYNGGYVTTTTTCINGVCTVK